MWLLIISALVAVCATSDPNGLEIDLRTSHGLLNNTTSISLEALQRIISGAEGGNKDNLYFLGLLKLYGITVTKDIDGAASAFERAAALGHADAQTALGVMKMKGLGVQQDYVGAVDMFRRSATQGNANGQWLLGRMLMEGKGIPHPFHMEAFIYASRAAASHVPQAQHLVAVMYEYGLGVDQNFPKAAEYYKRAAEQRYIESMYHLALMYMFGRGVDRNYPRALTLLEAGAVADHAPSCYYMGIMKTYGYGTFIDYSEASRWFEIAAGLDDERVSVEARQIAEQLNGLIDEADEYNNNVIEQFRIREEVSSGI